ncbi:MAG TPA: glycine cleavage system protein GcvH [Haliangium sp.]|nr:glycine cleavage system protein GcvH [Haliangium sp.]
MSEYPKDLKYTNEHEWVRIDGDVAIIGITSFAADQLGDVVAVELPEEGDKVTKGEVFGSVESVKAVADLFAPVSGTVSRVNTPLNDSPEYVNEDPFDEGWMIEVEMSDPEEAEELMDVATYADFVAEQE